MSTPISPNPENRSLPTVQIFGICSREGLIDARAGFGIDWGPKNPMNSGGPAIGEKTTLRAELTAILNVLKTATYNGISDPLCIRHQSESLENELRVLSDATQIESSQNADILRAIGELASQMEIRIEMVAPDCSYILKDAILIAKRVAGLHSTSAIPVTDENYEDGCRIVDIHGVCRDGYKNAIAGYAVFWGYRDKRNRNGVAHGPQTTNQAYFTALYKALETAYSSNHDEIIIRTRSGAIENFINKGLTSKLSRDCCTKLNAIFCRFSKVKYMYPKKGVHCRGQREAEEISNLARMRRTHVCISGMETSTDGIARYGMFWGHEDKRNGAGWIGGQHGQLCAEMSALGEAIELALKEGAIHMTVYTDSEDLKKFLNDWRKRLKNSNWPTPTGKPMKCMEKCKLLDVMLDKISVDARDGHEGYLQGARLMAVSVKGCTIVRTFGVLISGNNEPTARYGIFWQPKDDRNESGFIPGEQTLMRAKMIAIRRSLEIAVNQGITKLLVQTDLEREDGDEILLKDIQSLTAQMEYVKFERHDAKEFHRKLYDMEAGENL